MPLNSLGSILLPHFSSLIFLLTFLLPLTLLNAIVGTAYAQVESEFI